MQRSRNIINSWVHKYSTAAKIDIKSISLLRKAAECSISKAKEALALHPEYETALAWIHQDAITTATKKAAKIQTKAATEGLVGVTNNDWGYGSAIVELNCETDFVAKSSLFTQLVERTAKTSLLYEMNQDLSSIQPISVESLLKRVLVDADGDSTVSQGCIAVIGKLGENIKVRRGILYHANKTTVTASYAHAAGQLVPAGLGRVAALVVLQSDVELNLEQRKEVTIIAKKVAQHVTGFNPASISGKGEECLLNQSFLFGGGTVAEILQKESTLIKASLNVIEMQRLECGEGLAKEVTNFAQEVKDQIDHINSAH